MKLTRIKIYMILMSLSQLAALIALSQAVSFARWNQWKPISNQINFHATLLALVAFGLFSMVLIIRSLTERIEKLEQVVASATQPDIPIDAV
jgi:hypothetical protein